MKKSLLILFLISLVSMLGLSSCSGDLAVENITVTGGLKLEYSLGEIPDFSSVTATVSYNDGSSKNVMGDELTFGEIDTSTVGKKQISISYGGYSTTFTVTVTGKVLDTSDQIITAVSLPDSLALWEINKSEFINQNCGYTVGDDNPFILTLNLSVYSKEGEKIDVTSYTSASSVYIQGSATPLSGEELSKYVSIDEEKNSFDFTQEAIGMTFTISTRPRDGVTGVEDEMTKSFTVTVVDGYNIYEAYQLNYITNNNSGFNFSTVDSTDTRTQYEVVCDFLKYEKNTTHPGSVAGIVLHKNLTIERTDIPKEYFFNKNRDCELYDDISIFNNATTDEQKSFTLHGNYFSIYSYNLPFVVGMGVGNQDNQASNASLFNFCCNAEKDKYFDHTAFSANIENLLLLDDSPQSDNIESGDKSFFGLIAFKTREQVINFKNSTAEAYFITLIAETDYHTVNLTECIFSNSWQNHIQLMSTNPIQSDDEEPLSKAEYPRLTVNIEKSKISQSGGPAIIMLTDSPERKKNKHSGPSVHISADSTVESWVTGEEAWFKSLGISAIAQQIKNFDRKLQTIDSSFIKEDVRLVDGKPTTFKIVNIIAVNLLVPDFSLSIGEMFGQIQGKTDIDGLLSYGNKILIDMEDSSFGGFTDPTVSELKAESSNNHVLTTPEGGVGCMGTSHPFAVEKGDLSAVDEDDFITIYFYSMALAIGNYHPIISN